MKVSVVVTVLNELNDIDLLLDSLLKQTRKPDEIVVVDGGSKDGTFEKLKAYESKKKTIKAIYEKGSMAHGRNVAVKAASNSVVAQTDAGCIADKHWLRRITEPFRNEKTGLVAGFYVMTGTRPIQRAVAPFFGIHPRRFDPRCFMPSGRSMAFRKKVWEEVGGYSESLERAGEDTLFNYKVLKANINITRVPEAFVYWEVPRTLREALKKFYTYAKGDAEAAIWWHPAQRVATHSIKIATIFGRYLLFLALLYLSLFNSIFLCFFIIILSLYLTWSSWKAGDMVNDIRARLLIPVVQLGSDICVMSGFASAYFKKAKNKL
jgi:glycosyltransferase involved in cell wall biosynthesis